MQLVYKLNVSGAFPGKHLQMYDLCYKNQRVEET